MTDHKSTESKAQSVRTVIYAIVTMLCVGLGVSTYYRNQPVEMAEFEKVGEEFYPDFNNPNEATSLKVTVFDEEQATIQSFEVEQVDGLWRIPTHYNYPADATEQLAKTASSIIGIKREALISRRESDHPEYGVADPTSRDEKILKGRGDRITLKKGDEVLADYIVGKAYPEKQGAFFVRAPGEKETYVAEFDVELSTKFQDWIDVDLLKIERDTVTDIIVNKYTLAEKTDPDGRTYMGTSDVEEIDITREKFGTPWEIKQLEADEEVNSDAVKALVSTLVDTKIIGVRPKPDGLTPALGVTPEAARNPLMIANIRSDLATKGYFLVPQGENQLGIIAQEGSFYAATNEGLVYELHFGNVFTGDLREIELGQDSEADEEETTNEAGSEPGNSKAENSEGDKGESGAEQQQSRYLFVKVNFEPAYLGEEPTKPEPPQEPQPEAPNAPLRALKPGEQEIDPQTNYEIAMQAYEEELAEYEKASEEYNQKLEAGTEKADELNERLGAWYYVVPADNVDALRVTRASLVQPKGTDEAEQGNQPGIPGSGGLPGIPGLPQTPPGLKLPQGN
ncbi:MAG: DUF4340 domain-containing protein [Planctomycetaceae bacterium]|nr:DUF4340 domain-containing protein [Planctomycetaceae bacterium]